MTVAYSAVRQPLCYRGENTNLYALAFEDRTMFFARQAPLLFDAQANRIAVREIRPGAYVNVRYQVEKGITRMTAVQIARSADEQRPFDRITDDGHGLCSGI
jgi:hypothetical protein